MAGDRVYVPGEQRSSPGGTYWLELTVETHPRRALAERMRATARQRYRRVLHPDRVGTLMADDGLPWRYHTGGSVAPGIRRPRVHATAAAQEMVLEESIVTDYALVMRPSSTGRPLGSRRRHSISTRPRRCQGASPWSRPNASSGRTCIPTRSICPASSCGAWSRRPRNGPRTRRSRSAPSAPGADR